MVAVLAVAGPYIFFHYVEGSAPAPLSLKASATQSASGSSTPGSPDSVAGSWKAG